MSRHGGLNSTKVEGHIRDLLDNLPLLVALVILIRVKRIDLRNPGASRLSELISEECQAKRRPSAEVI